LLGAEHAGTQVIASDTKLKKHKDTMLAHLGRDAKRFEGAVNTPIIRASTILAPTVAAFEAAHSRRFTSPYYGRYGTATNKALEQAVAQLEGGYRCIALPSGLAAITAALLGFLKSGDHLLMVDTVYGPTRRFCDEVLPRHGVGTTYYDPHIGSGIDPLIRPETRVVYCEAPGSLTFEMQDIPAIAEAAHRRGAVVLADNTWGTPYHFPSFARGVDVSIHAATKYIAGHSDVMLGLVVTNEACWEPVREAVAAYGFAASPDDCYLGLRGLRTLGVRLQRHQASAHTLANWLAARPEVARVAYPALPGDPGHSLWKRDFSGACGLFAIEFTPVPKAAADAFIDALELFGIGASWGGYESLAVPVRAEKLRTATKLPNSGPMVRLHVGLEDPDELIVDLEQGLAAMRAAAHA
jgi:cystathionine beta-lyase